MGIKGEGSALQKKMSGSDLEIKQNYAKTSQGKRSCYTKETERVMWLIEGDMWYQACRELLGIWTYIDFSHV